MPEFYLDTSGEIIGTGKPNRNGQPSTFWNHLDSFTQGYIQALFFTDCEHGTVSAKNAAEGAGWEETSEGQWSRGPDPDDGAEVIADSAEQACELSDISNVWNPEEHSNLPGDVAFSDLAPSALARIIADCAKFQEAHDELLDDARNLVPGDDGFKYGRDALDDERLGMLFWYARNGHGVAFTDDGDAPCLQALQNAARAFCGSDVYLGDDGLIYIMGAE